MPVERIRFVHDARNDKEKGELFAACRNGRVSVLIGSTEKMGVGTNVQARAVALHHLDCPWRPADIAQREGRILRQGNLNPEVEVIRYVAEGSFDAYLWQTVERKARFIGQVMRGSLDVREIEDVGDIALSYSEVKALATGDPRILEKAKLDAEVTRLERLERFHTRNQRTLSTTIDKAEKSIGGLEAAVAQIDQAIEHRIDTTADRFAMTVGSTRWTSRADAATALRNALAAIGGTTPDTTQYAAWDTRNHLGSIGGFDITATPRRFLEPHLSLELAGIPRSHIRVDYDELRVDRPLGIVIQLENRVRDLERTRHKIETEAAGLAREAEQARADYGKPFTRREALDTARARSTQLAAELAEQDKQREQAATPSTPAGTPGTPTPPPPTSAHDALAAARAAADHNPSSPDQDAPARARSRSSPSSGADGSTRAVTARTPSGTWPTDASPRSAAARMACRRAVSSAAHSRPGPKPRPTWTRSTPATPPTRPNSPPTGPTRPATAAVDQPPSPTEIALDNPPPGGWTDADRVTTPSTPDTSSYPSAQRYPIGTALTVHAVTADGTAGRRLGHGNVTDHPGPEHVTVESPYGTRRVAHLNHVSQPHQAPPPPTSNPLPPHHHSLTGALQ